MTDAENKARIAALEKTPGELAALISPYVCVAGLNCAAALAELRRRADLLPKAQQALRDAENVAYDLLEKPA